MQTEFSRLRQQAGVPIDKLADLVGFSSRTLYRWEKGQAEPRKAAIAYLRELTAHKRIECTNSTFTFVDLFAGIGGLRRGFESIGGSCVFTSEWNTYAQLTYKANYRSDDKIEGDITKVRAEAVPEHDVLLAGFPCQPFSIAGVSKKNALGRAHGFRCESQGTLFFDVARMIEYHRPRAFLLENVKNLVNHDKGNTFRVIHDTLQKDLGYHLKYKVIDAKCFVPQHRERIFIVGFREPNSFTFDDLVLPSSLDGPRLRDILHSENGNEEPEGHYTAGQEAHVSDRYTLSDHLWRYLRDYADKHRKAGNGFGYGLFGPDDVARTLSARYYKDGSEILIKQDGRNPRRLTPRECSRLMGFDDPRESNFRIPVSDTQAYKQFGNSVVVPVVKAVARHMAPWILSGHSRSMYVQRQLPLYA